MRGPASGPARRCCAGGGRLCAHGETSALPLLFFREYLQGGVSGRFFKFILLLIGAFAGECESSRVEGCDARLTSAAHAGHAAPCEVRRL